MNTDTKKEKAKKEIEKIFKKMACKDPKKEIHKTALKAAFIVAGLPMGVDAWALRLCEIYMLMSIYSYYGISISQATAESFLTAAFAQAVGEALAYSSLEAADAAALLTGGSTLAICFAIAAGLIEAIGWTTIKYIEGNGIAKATLRAMEGIGFASDIGRVVNVVNDEVNTIDSSRQNATKSISFEGAQKPKTPPINNTPPIINNTPPINPNRVQAGYSGTQWINKANIFANMDKNSGVNYGSNVTSCATNGAKAILGPGATEAQIKALADEIIKDVTKK